MGSRAIVCTALRLDPGVTGAGLCDLAVVPEDMKVHTDRLTRCSTPWPIAARSTYMWPPFFSLHDNTRDSILTIKGSQVDAGPRRKRHEAICWALCQHAVVLPW